MSSSTVLVFEYFTGGGCPAGKLSSGLAAEALGMLWALLSDFHHWGAVRTITLLDPRFEELVPGLNRKTLPADEVVCASGDEFEVTYLSLLKRSNAVLVLAPETKGILAGLTAQAERAGIPVLGSNASAVAKAGDKAACNRLFRKAKLPSPKTRTPDFLSAARDAKELGCPLMVKPLDGVGCEGISRVDHLSGMPAALAMVRRVSTRERILLQSYTIGVHASVSLLMAKGRCLPLSLNRQLIETGLAFEYRGSQVPFDHRAGAYALDLACSAVELIPGLNGYVGVDLVLTEDRAQLIEINPRLTTSYIALRQVARVNLAQLIWEACRKGTLPDRVPLLGQALIHKDNPASWGLNPEKKPGAGIRRT